MTSGDERRYSPKMRQDKVPLEHSSALVELARGPIHRGYTLGLDLFTKKGADDMGPDRGADVETAITLEATCSEEAVRMENEHITGRYGARGMGWDKVGQTLVMRGDRYFDAVAIETGGRESAIYFDVSTAWAANRAYDAASGESESTASSHAPRAKT